MVFNQINVLLQDFEAIGIDKRGFRLRLQKAAKKLPSLPIYTDVPVSLVVLIEHCHTQIRVQAYPLCYGTYS